MSGHCEITVGVLFFTPNTIILALVTSKTMKLECSFWQKSVEKLKSPLFSHPVSTFLHTYFVSDS